MLQLPAQCIVPIPIPYPSLRKPRLVCATCRYLAGLPKEVQLSLNAADATTSDDLTILGLLDVAIPNLASELAQDFRGIAFATRYTEDSIHENCQDGKFPFLGGMVKDQTFTFCCGHQNLRLLLLVKQGIRALVTSHTVSLFCLI